MNQWEIAVRQLGDLIGADDLALDAHGRYAFTLESGRRIAGELSEGEMLVYASDPVPYDGSKRLLRAWRRAYLSPKEGGAVQTVLSKQNNQLCLLAVLRLKTEECSPYALRAAINLITSWLDDTCRP